MLCYYVLSQTHIKDSVLIFSQQTIFIILDVQKLLDRKTRFRITCQFKTSASCHATRLNADNRWRSEHCLKHHKKVEVSHIFLCISKIQILLSVSAGLFYGGQWPLAACLEWRYKTLESRLTSRETQWCWTNLPFPLHIFFFTRNKKKNRRCSILSTDDSSDKQYNQMTKDASFSFFFKMMTFALAC